MASGESKSAGGFKVTDRRSFTDETGARDEAPAVPPDGPNLPGAAGVSAEAPNAAFPPVDFHTFVLSLGSSALRHLGEIGLPPEKIATVIADRPQAIATARYLPNRSATGPVTNCIEPWVSA